MGFLAKNAYFPACSNSTGILLRKRFRFILDLQMIITNLNPDQTHIQAITDSAIVWLSGSRHKLSGFSDYKASLGQ